MTQTLALPSFEDATVVVPAPGREPGNWSGAASAVLVDGVFWLTYRVRRPLTEGRGVSVVVSRSENGVDFEPVVRVHRETFRCESFERPVLSPLPGGGWRLYLSCATYDSKHWWVDSLTAATVEQLPAGHQQVVLPGTAEVAVKDPVIQHPTAPGEEWVMWLCCHPLTEPGHEDRMTTRRLTSTDGLVWTDRREGRAGRPRPSAARGARVATVITTDPLTVLYDGRADAASNWHEATGLARWDGSRLIPTDDAPATSPYSDGAFRYACAVALPDGRTRFYVEAARPDGAHDLVTVVR